MTTETNPPISIAQGIATYILMEDSCSMKEMTHYMLIIRNNLLNAHNDLKLDLHYFQDTLDETENKVWQFETGWNDVEEEKEQSRINEILSKKIPSMSKDSDDYLLAQMLSTALLSTNQPELRDSFVRTLDKVTEWILKAYLIENLNIEKLLSYFVIDNKDGVMVS